MDAAFDEPAARPAHGGQQQQPSTTGGDAFAPPHQPGEHAWPAQDDGRTPNDDVDAGTDRSYLPHLTADGYASFAAPAFGDEQAATYAAGFGHAFEHQPAVDGSPRLTYSLPPTGAGGSAWPFEAGWAALENGSRSVGSQSEDDADESDADDASPARAPSPTGPFITTAAAGLAPLGRSYRLNAAIAPPNGGGGESLLASPGGHRPATAVVAQAAVLPQPTTAHAAPARPPPADRQLSSGLKPTLKLSRADKVAIIHEHDAKPSLTQQETATKWSVDRSTISKILHSRDRWLAPASPPRVPAVRPPPRKVTLRPEGGRYKPVEERINLWLDQRYQVGVVVDDIAVRNEAREVWRMLQRDAGEDVGEDVDDSKSFKASAKWLGSFKDRRRLSGRLMAPLPPPDRPPPSPGSAPTSRSHSATCSPGGLLASPHSRLQPPASQSVALPSQQLLQQQPMQPRRALAHRLSSLSIPPASVAAPAHALPFSPPDSASSAGFAGSQPIAGGAHYAFGSDSPRGRSFSASTGPPLTEEAEADDGLGGGGGGAGGLLSPFSADWTSAAPGRFAQQQQQPPRRPGSISRHTNPVYPPGEPTPTSGGGLGNRPNLAQRPHSTTSVYPHYQPSPAQSESSQTRRRLGSGFEAKTQRTEGSVSRRDSSLASPATAEARSRTSSRTGSWAPSSPSASLFDRLEEERRRNSSVTSYGSSLIPPAPAQHSSQLTPGKPESDEGRWVVNAPTPPAAGGPPDYFPHYAQPAGNTGGSAQYSQPPSPRQQSLGLPHHQSYTGFNEPSSHTGPWAASQPSPLESAYESTSPGPVFGDAWSRPVPQHTSSGYGPAESDWHSGQPEDQHHHHGYHPEQAMSVDPFEFSRDLQELRLGSTPAPPPVPAHYSSAPPGNQGWVDHAGQWEKSEHYAAQPPTATYYSQEQPQQQQHRQHYGSHDVGHYTAPQQMSDASGSYPPPAEHGSHFANPQTEDERVGHPHAEYAPYYTSHPASYPPQATSYGHHHSSAKEPASYDPRSHGVHGAPPPHQLAYGAPPSAPRSQQYLPDGGHGHDHPDTYLHG